MPEALPQTLYAAATWYRDGRGPRYAQLCRHITAAIRAGLLPADAQLPAERDLADLAEVSRVTVRKAVAQLVAEGLVEQRRGAGSFVLAPQPKMEHSLSTLVSFTEYMQQRGKTSSSRILLRGLYPPFPEEQIALGLASSGRVARIERLRSADGVPMAIEHSSLPADILPDPELVDQSLYVILRASGNAPTRAVQRMSAVNLSAREADLLNLTVGTAVLKVDRTGYLSSGRPIEFTSGIYRSDFYNFIAELRLGEPA